LPQPKVAPDMAEIRLEGVTKRFGDFTALDDVSLTIADGAFTSIFGPPGSGKSVLLRVLLGLDPVDRGRIIIDGRDVTDAAPNDRGLSMVFQNLALFPHLTARQNIAFPMVRRGTPAAEIATRLDRLASVLSISHILEKKPAALSGGERQRVAIGRALIRDAAAYMMDEPIAALDARLRDVMRVELKRLQTEQGQTFIYVTHDCDEAMSVADTMIILNRGRIIQSGRPDDIYTAPATLAVAELVGSPRINVIETAFGKSAFGTLGPPGPAAVVAIRPEALTLLPPLNATLYGTVEDIERLGSFCIVTVANSGQRLRVIAENARSVTIGQDVGLAVAARDLHHFDAANGARMVPA
jgi:multiple sugar transport system ATP-binding protein